VPRRLLPNIGVNLLILQINLGALSGYPLLVLAAGKLKPNPSPATQFNYAPNLLMLTAAVGYTLLSGAQEYHM
jgi:hypothetical protein